MLRRIARLEDKSAIAVVKIAQLLNTTHPMLAIH